MAEDHPATQLTSSEFVSTMSHFHRAEDRPHGRLARPPGSNERNWAITVVAAMLSVSLSTPNAHHGVLIFAMLLILLLLSIEARRYRFFELRARVRKIERHYFAQVCSPQAEFASNWLSNLGTACARRNSWFRIGSRRPAASRNYLYMYLILLLAWVLKISTSSLQPEGVGIGFVGSVREAVSNAALGPVPGWLVVVIMAASFAALFVSGVPDSRR